MIQIKASSPFTQKESSKREFSRVLFALMVFFSGHLLQTGQAQTPDSQNGLVNSKRAGLESNEAQEDSETKNRVEWLRANTVKVRSIDPKEEDFSDLREIKALLTNAEVVMLGPEFFFEIARQCSNNFLYKTFFS